LTDRVQITVLIAPPTVGHFKGQITTLNLQFKTLGSTTTAVTSAFNISAVTEAIFDFNCAIKGV